jgi:phosphate transport system substrate-binding protein
MIDGTTDIAMASRELKTEEKWNLLMKSGDWASYNCIWCINSIVNPANSVSKLTREQLEQIFRSNQNWKEVGGADEK